MILLLTIPVMTNSNALRWNSDEGNDQALDSYPEEVSHDNYYADVETEHDCFYDQIDGCPLHDMDETIEDVHVNETRKTSQINESKYETADIDAVVRKCSHLSQNQQNDLRAVLEKHPVLFNNQLGSYPDEKIHLDIDEHAEGHTTRAYTVPHNHLKVFKSELDRLVDIGVLERGSRSEWTSGTFVIPKKLLPDEDVPRVRWVSDF